MRSIFRDRSFLATAGLVLLALSYAACGPERRPSVNFAGCSSAVDCLTDGYAPGSTCVGGYCLGPEVHRDCVSTSQCRERGLGNCVMNLCEVPPQPSNVDAFRVDAPGTDVGPLDDAFVEPIDAMIPLSGAT